MSRPASRVQRESQTVAALIRLYCAHHHKPADGALCSDCRPLLDYARQRLGRCPFQEGKTTCAQCPVHCYQPRMRERIRDVMRFAGPRLLLRHPFLSLFHLLDKRRKSPLPRRHAQKQ